MKLNKYKLLDEMSKQSIGQKELVALSGVSRATISSIFSGKRVSYNTATKIARALKINISDIAESEV